MAPNNFLCSHKGLFTLEFISLFFGAHFLCQYKQYFVKHQFSAPKFMKFGTSVNHKFCRIFQICISYIFIGRISDRGCFSSQLYKPAHLNCNSVWSSNPVCTFKCCVEVNFIESWMLKKKISYQFFGIIDNFCQPEVA